MKGIAAPQPEGDEDQNPLRLLHGVYTVIQEELGATALRKPVEAALNGFANHPKTREWLAEFRK